MSTAAELTDPDSATVLESLVHEDPLVWWEAFTKIEDKDHALISPVANRLQRDLAEYVVYCRKHKLPIRAVIPKPRQKGISTITVAIIQWFQKILARDGLIVGGKDWQVSNLWAIYQRYASTDEFPWGFSGYVQETQAEWGNGSKLKRQTAGGKDPGRSATIQLLVGTEVAYWGHDAAVKNASAVLTGLLACVPAGHDTAVFLESTSSGGSGLFYRRCMDAVPLADFLNGARHPSGWVRIFRGWHEFEDSTLPVADKQEEMAILRGEGARNAAEKAREASLRMAHRLTAGQIKYYRKLLADCDNDPDKRDLEYPTTLEDAFRASQPGRFNSAMLRVMRDEAHLAVNDVRAGNLEQPVRDVPHYVWSPTESGSEGESNFWIWEHPQIGMRYVIAVDNAGGRADGDDKTDTDCHAVVVLRAGSMDPERGRWIKPAVVAAIPPKQRVDIDILGEWVWRLHVYYGRCLVAPEANNDRGLIRDLRVRGCVIYESERPATQKASYKPSGKLGFWTRGGENEGTRRWIIENLARAIRERDRAGEGIDCLFPWILDELDHFVVNPDSGKAEAMEGWHDDWVLALAIGFALIGGATIYMPSQNSLAIPRDLRLGRDEGGALGFGGADRV